MRYSKDFHRWVIGVYLFTITVGVMFTWFNLTLGLKILLAVGCYGLFCIQYVFSVWKLERKRLYQTINLLKHQLEVNNVQTKE